MSSIPPPIRRPGSGPTSIRPRAAPRPSLLHAIRTPAPKSSSSSSAMPPPPFSSSSSLKPTRTCPNKSCPRPDIADGICRTCGRVVDDSNIVSEVTFGETSSGAAMVQGSFLSADQGGIRSLGANFRRVGGGGSGGGEDREKSVREAKMYIQGFAEQLNLAESLVNTAVQAFKLASNANFIQGRSLPGVAAVCLYVACRNERPCKIMLLDLADLVQINVFKLGRTFKAFNKAIPICNDGLEPVYPEDLIYRFASKLEFAGQTAKVAEDAVRLVKRMSRDWMVMGRRPSGICGACLLMAARMNNFRRTVREVVYIVKVTNHTIQNRLEEFKVTESSAMTVEDFLSQDLLESSHDPPSFYRKSAEYQARMRRKRKRGCNDDDDDYEGEEEEETEGEVPVDPILGGASSTGIALDAAPATATTTTETDKHINKALRIGDKEANLALEDPESEAALSTLARSFGATVEAEAEAEADNDDNDASSDAKGKRKQMPVDPEWEADENELEAQISEIFNDPHTQEHATAFTTAQKVATERSKEALAREPTKKVSMAAEVGEDEFANDPEVLNCLLSEEEARIKEVVWSNENKDWLRAQQEKVFRMKLAAERPRQTRRRKKRPRMGEGQSEPAGSAVEAAVSVMKERGISKRINYEAIRSLFEVEGEGGDEGENEEAGEEEVQEEEEEEEYEQMGSPEGFDEEELDEGEEEEEPEDYGFED